MTEPAPKPAEPLDADEAPSSRVPVSMAADAPKPGRIASFASAILIALRFYSRLPVPVVAFETLPHDPLDLSRDVPAVALAGGLIGAVAAGVLAVAGAAGLPPLLSATIAIATLAVITGALHEDGLADTFDGLWGGSTRERRLEIMRDSRVGSYGVASLVLSLAVRVFAIAALMEQIGSFAALVIISVAATSRVTGLVPLWLLPSARSDGAAASVTAPGATSMVWGALTALAVSCAVLWPAGVALAAIVLGSAAAFAASWGLGEIARAKIGGYTGDIAGAAQQAAEIAMLIVLVAAAG